MLSSFFLVALEVIPFFSQIQHQYCLTDEKGPAHKKIFTVTLKLGPSESYNAHGPSIKKAQHSAAETALSETSYKHPPPKPTKIPKQSKCLAINNFNIIEKNYFLLCTHL